MKKSADNSSATACSTDIESSSAASEGAASEDSASEDFDLERDIPTTQEDVRVLREIRRQPGKNLLPYIDELLNPRQFENIPPRRSTSEGWEPFELD